MMYFREEENIGNVFPGILRPYFEGLNVGVFDIETTGLSPDRSHFVLGGLITPMQENENVPDGKVISEQFFAESLKDEKEALSSCMDKIRQLDVVITYNGTHFDIPFIMNRAGRCGINCSKGLPHNFDLYRLINRYSELRKAVPDLKQKTAERFLGIAPSREDEIDGALSVQLYHEWERTGEDALLKKILLHNADDIKQLSKLMPIVRKADVHRGMANMGFPAKGLSVNAIRVEKDRLTVKGLQRKTAISYSSYDYGKNGSTVIFDRDENSFMCSFRTVSTKGLVIIDLTKYIEDTEIFERYPSCASGYIVIKQGKTFNYDVINLFIKTFLNEFQRKMED